MDFDFNFELAAAPQVESGVEQPTTHSQAVAQQPFHTQQTVQPQYSHEQQTQQLSTEVDNAQKVSDNNDLFGDLEYERLAAELEPLATFNAEN